MKAGLTSADAEVVIVEETQAEALVEITTSAQQYGQAPVGELESRKSTVRPKNR